MAPLERDLTLAGPSSAAIRMSSTSADSELVATLETIAPGGKSYLLTSGAQLGSLRAVDRDRSWNVDGERLMPHHPYTAASRTELEPGEVKKQEIELPAVFARLARGHRLRLTLSTSAPHLHPTLAQLPGLEGGVYDVQRGGAGASFLSLPLADPADLRTSARSFGECNSQC